MRARLALVLPVLSVSLAAQATLALPVSLRSVRVHPDEAWVTRAGSLRVERAGLHRLEIPGLPGGLSLEDLRVSAKGPEGSRLGDVSVSTSLTADPVMLARRKEALAQLEQVRIQRDGLESRREAAAQGLAFLKALLAVQGKEGQERLAAALPQALGYLDLERGFQARTSELLSEERRLALELEKLGAEQRKQEAAIRTLEGTLMRSASTLSLELLLAHAGLVEVTVVNRTREARWKPSYEARFSPDLKQLELVLFAAVSQRTFEDWASVPVELSTVASQRKMVMPAFTSTTALGWTPPEPRLPVEDRSSSSVSGLAGVAGGVHGGVLGGVIGGTGRVVDVNELQPAPKPLPMLESPTVAIQQIKGLSATFRIPAATVAADAAWHRFRVQALPLEPSLHHVVAPRLDPTVFQMARFAVPAGFPRFPGSPVVPFLGDERLPQTAFANGRPGEPVELNLGPFEGLRTSLERLDEKNPYRVTKLSVRHSRTGTARLDEVREEVSVRGKERVWTLDERIVASNDGDEALELEVLDQVVASTHASVKVELKAEPEAPKPESPQTRRWKLQVPARATTTLTLGLIVRGPKDGSVQGLEQLGLTED